MTKEAKQVAVAATAAFVAAAVLLLIVILPAEYGWDPLGAGELLGVAGLSYEDSDALREETGTWRRDSVTFELPPFASVEYKYRLEQGQTLLYDWQSTGELVIDMHSEPDGAAPGYAQSFRQMRGEASNGSFRAPFSGIHGWFFQNRGQDTVTITLNTRGFFTYAIEFSEGREIRREF